MSKLADRMPALANPATRLDLTIEKMDALVENGRVDLTALHDQVVAATRDFPINTSVIEEEGRKAIATQCISQLTSQRVITIDRRSRAPVYQTSFGFAGNWFKVGSELVAPEAMTLQDFDVLIERIEHRMENAGIDRDAWIGFRDRARPGLEEGRNLVEQFESGGLELFAADAPVAVEPAAEGNGNGAAAGEE